MCEKFLGLDFPNSQFNCCNFLHHPSKNLSENELIEENDNFAQTIDGKHDKVVLNRPKWLELGHKFVFVGIHICNLYKLVWHQGDIIDPDPPYDGLHHINWVQIHLSAYFAS